ncbi:FAD-dependent oxidoreductase [Anoxynatronum buryatiense]|uniref:2,4-dienoyl-CoA reductase n=1 Tax=Anoxynatronum buryatiense TaxID=489973 RepID=A0AA45WYN9_9CLOT|nr:FAD-dependent oxidoreductase [Anoxynatronum buryatiense]SMP68268.1 2,4-dienoyl-CoA reductase [Anoxynatronum buryatiense]
MKSHYQHLLAPLEIRGYILKNRMAACNSLPHFLQGPEPFPADSVIAHFANKAKSGAAIVTCMGINNFSRGAGLPMELDIAHFPDYDLYDPASQNYLMQLADTIHFYGSIACMGFFVGPQSGYPLMENNKLRIVDVNKAVEDFEEETLQLIAKSYAEQIGILKFLGFDMASIHYAYRGQIPAKFLSPLTNHRGDAYGGSLENRARFPLMVLEKVRETVGNHFLIELVMSAEEPKGGYTIEEAAAFIKMAEPYIDIVQLRAADVEQAHPTGFNLIETPFIHYAQYIKNTGTKVKIATVGGYHDFDTCEEVIKSGKADIISMARSWISNPNYGELAYNGNKEDLVPCLRCNKCHGRGKNDPFVSICSVNPIIGIEHRVDQLVTTSTTHKKVAVIGGGPTGMKTAMDLHDRGHQVTLYEAGESLGGMIRHADHVDFKWPLKQFKDFLIRQIEKRRINVMISTKASPDMIREQGYDAVVVAIGAQPFKPPIPGVEKEHVLYGEEIFEKPDAVGHRVVVIGGGEVGVEAGMYLAKRGHDVTVLEMRDELAADSTLIHYREMFREAWESIPNFKCILNARCSAIENERVIFYDKMGKENSVMAESVVISVGMVPLKAEALEFYGTAHRFYMAGDCQKPATIQQAMRSAFSTASNI